jgi:hypothetical protein
MQYKWLELVVNRHRLSRYIPGYLLANLSKLMCKFECLFCPASATSNQMFSWLTNPFHTFLLICLNHPDNNNRGFKN